MEGTAPFIARQDFSITDARSKTDVLPKRVRSSATRVLPDGPIKTFTLRGIKDSPPYCTNGRTADARGHRRVLQSRDGDSKLTSAEKDSLVAYMLAL
jgi:hypothetical protein